MGDSSSASYIHMVHHLIEKCLIFRMSKEECMEALSKHANIKPVITSTGQLHIPSSSCIISETILNFSPSPSSDTYILAPRKRTRSSSRNMQSRSKDDRMSQEETTQMIQKIISSSDFASKDSHHDGNNGASEHSNPND
ncbi:hypothetical protein BT93_G2173 [Corymbia citriodora subsp. variegata]|nr:hypothetical protein BT93_G2173 [Corymbia citriodora subsp. variegata]